MCKIILMQKILLFTLTLLSANLTQAQNVNIPDVNFKNYLLNNTAINTNGDGQIQVSEAIAFNGSLFCGNKNISNLTGIEAFVNITELFCFSNQLTTLDLSQNTSLIYVTCASNQLTSLNVKNGNNTALLGFYASGNPNLQCIQIDNTNTIGSNWGKDATATYSSNCQSFLANEETLKKSILTYPNPVKNILQLSTNTNATLYNMVGQKSGSYKNVSQINMGYFAKGIYILIISDKKGEIIQQTKIVKE